MQQVLLTAAEIGEMLRIKPARVYELVREGILPSVKVGRQIRFSSQRIQDWIEGGGQSLSGGWRHDPDIKLEEIRERSVR